MPIVKNDTNTVLLITGGAEDGSTLKLAPKGKKGDKVDLGKVNDAIRKAEKNKLVKTFSGKRSGGGTEKDEPPKANDGSKKPEQPKTGEK